MSGYTPLFETLTRGTLYGRWPDIGLWPIVLSLADWRGIVDVTPEYIAGVTGLEFTEVVACMDRFCQPDPRSRSQEHGGARLMLLDPNRSWGWQVVNHGKYREKAREMNRTESGAAAEKQRRYRERQREQAAGNSDPALPGVTRSYSSNPDSDSDSDIYSPDKSSLSDNGVAPAHVKRAATATLIPDGWQPNEINRKWMVESGLTPREQAKVVGEFIRWAQHSTLCRSNWQLTFSRNPHVKGAIGRGRSSGIDQTEKRRAQISDLAKILGLDQGADDWPMFEKRVTLANAERIEALERRRSGTG
jgi:hypothetical protein